MKQKSSDVWPKFQKQKRRIAVAEANVSNTPSGNYDKKGVSELSSSFIFFGLLHHRQILVWTPENEGSESKIAPNF